jgi:hypothetical protein
MSGGCGIELGCFTDTLVHSSINDHEDATEPLQNGPAARGAVIVTLLRMCHGVSNLNEVLICDQYFVAFVLSQGVRHCWRIVY